MFSNKKDEEIARLKDKLKYLESRIKSRRKAST